MNKWKLFIDDERIPNQKYSEIKVFLSRLSFRLFNVNIFPWFLVARNCEEAKKYVEVLGCPQHISFDHDLGCYLDETGYDFTKWLVNMVMDGKIEFPEDFEYHIHSANPVGRANIHGYLNSYFINAGHTNLHYHGR